jgi:hypothetical protein
MATSDDIKRAETGLRIAQLKFKQGLRREDDSRPPLPPVSLESSASFCDHVDAALQRTTTDNVQVSIKTASSYPEQTNRVYRLARIG